MKKLWKIYDLSLIFILLAVLLCTLTAVYSYVLAAAQLVLVIGFALAKYIYHIEVKEKLLYKIKIFINQTYIYLFYKINIFNIILFFYTYFVV